MKNQFKVHILIIMALVFVSFIATSCSNIEKSTESSKQISKAKSSVSEVKSSINVPTIEQIVTTLSSDEFEGRRTFSKGNEKAGEYIANIFANIGLNPLSENSYFQKYTQNGYNNKYNSYKTVQNIVGYIKGKDSEKAIIISAHFDSLGIKDGTIIRGALDNASGVAALIEIAKKLKEVSLENPFESNVIFVAFNGEEQSLGGSNAFVKQSKSKSWYKNMYNINIDSIGAKNGGKFVFPNYSKYSKKLSDAVKSSMKKNNLDLTETKQIFASDHWNFEIAKKANISISQENLKKWAHKPTDIPDILDYKQIEKIASALSDFVINNDGIVY